MFSKSNPYLILDDLRGGVNDADSPVAIEDKALTDCRNVDYRFGHIGSKRGGTTPISLGNSVFARAVPGLVARDVGGFVGANTGSFATTTVTGSNTNQIMVVFIGLSSAVSVNSVTLGGVALTRLGGLANTVQIDIWYLKNPNLAGGSLQINLAGAVDCHAIAERWDSVDIAISPASFATTSSTGTIIQPSSNAFNPTAIVLNGVAWGAATLTQGVQGAVTTNAGANGNGKASSIAIVGMKPTSQFNLALSVAVVWASAIFGLWGITTPSGALPIKALITYTQTNDPLDDELWAQDSQGRLDRRVGGVWQGGVPVQNFQVGSFLTGGYFTNGVSLHGKLFLALEGTVYADRVHVWDGTVLRWGGFAPPAQLTAADTVPGGAYATIRYARFRYTQQVAGITVRRSEPCANLAFTPAGTKTGMTVTLPASGGFISGEGETHWEIELSTDNVLFYRVATQVVATTTYTDTTTFAGAGTYSSNPLSENIGEYVPMQAVRHVTVDEDRLLGAGSTVTVKNDSRAYWTILTADAGVGNDERVPVATRHFLDLDGLYGGRITHMLPATFGGILCFKDQRVYKLLRTGRAAKAYDSQLLTPARGAMMRAAAYGTDADGQPCVYFWDPNIGAIRYGMRGFEDLMQDRRRLVQSVNRAANLPVMVQFHPKHWLMWFFVATGAATTPSYCACFNIRQNATTDYDGPMATAVSGTLFKDRTSLEMRPYLAVATVGTSAVVEADKGVNDDGVRFRGYFTSKAFEIGELMREFQLRSAMVHAKAAASVVIGLAIIRNLGLERKDVTAAIDPLVGGQTYVSTGIDDATMAECNQAQIELGDPASYAGAQLDQTWQLDQTVLKFRFDDESVGG